MMKRVLTENVEEVLYLRCNHEEADTRIVLHAKDASQSKDAAVIICEDTDVFSIAISKAEIISVPIYMKRGTQNRTRFVDITHIFTNLGSDLAQSIPGIHAFTGCDSVSAFAGKGKVAALQVLHKHPLFQKTFSMFGEEIEVKYKSHKTNLILCLILNISAFIFLVSVKKKTNTEIKRTD